MEPHLAAKPLTEIQRKVLAEIFRDRNAGPRSVAQHCNIKLGVALSAIFTLRKKKYLAHDRGFKQTGRNNACYRPLKTLTGKLIPELTRQGLEDLVSSYLRSHVLKKLPCGAAESTYRSSISDREL